MNIEQIKKTVLGYEEIKKRLNQTLEILSKIDKRYNTDFCEVEVTTRIDGFFVEVWGPNEIGLRFAMEADKWVANISDPNKPVSKRQFKYVETCKKTKDQQWAEYLEWVKQFEIGPPKPTHIFTAEELSKAGQVGLYKKG